MKTNHPKTDAIWKPKVLGSQNGGNFIFQFADNCRDTEYYFACSLEEENFELRAMLAFAHCGAALYADDGELQDNREHPFIDWKRDSLSEIREKLLIRAYNNPEMKKMISEGKI